MTSLSEIAQWPADHLSGLATYFNNAADNHGNTMDSILASTNSIDYTGIGNDGMQTAQGRNAAVANEHAAIMRLTAGVAQGGYTELYGLQQTLGNAAALYKSQGFSIADDGTATDAMFLPQYRAGIAAAYTNDLQSQATAFNQARDQVAAGITASSQGLQGDPPEPAPGTQWKDKNGDLHDSYGEAWCVNNYNEDYDQCWAYSTAGERIGAAGAGHFGEGGDPTQAQLTGIVECWEGGTMPGAGGMPPITGHWCSESEPGGNGHTFWWPGDVSGVWPDGTRTPGVTPGAGTHIPTVIHPGPTRPGGSTGPGRGIQMMDNGDGWDNPPMKPVGGEPIIGGGGVGSVLEQQAARDAGPKLAAMPADWPKNVPAPAIPHCPPGELVGDAATTSYHTMMETAGALLLPGEGPAVVPSVLALGYGAKTVADDARKLIDCIERAGGVG